MLAGILVPVFNLMVRKSKLDCFTALKTLTCSFLIHQGALHEPNHLSSPESSFIITCLRYFNANQQTVDQSDGCIDIIDIRFRIRKKNRKPIICSGPSTARTKKPEAYSTLCRCLWVRTCTRLLRRPSEWQKLIKVRTSLHLSNPRRHTSEERTACAWIQPWPPQGLWRP